MKNSVKKLLVLLTVCMLLPCAALADAPLFTVNGTAEVSAPADLLTISVQVSAVSQTLEEAQAEINAVTAAVTEGLLALGIAEDDIVTSGYSFYPIYDYEGELPVQTGFSASHTLKVTLRDLLLTDAMIDVMTRAGITEIGGMVYGVSDSDALYHQALAAALGNARQKAETLAAAAGCGSLQLVSLQETSMGASSVVTYRAAKAAADEEESASAGLRSGSVTVSASVQAVFAGE